MTRQKSIKDITLTAILAATILGGKYALAFVPNVEIVTLMIMVYAYVFGAKITLADTLIFVTAEIIIFGFNTWVIAYLIYWPMLAILSSLAAKLVLSRHDAASRESTPARLLTLAVYVSLAVICTAMFGVISSVVDAVAGYAKTGFSFEKLFLTIYLRGVTFYLIHVISNSIIVASCFLPLSKLLCKLSDTYYGNFSKIIT